MKNCIVLSGQYRTFDSTWENIKDFIDINQADVYCHLWSTDENEENSVVEKLKPKKYLVEDYQKYVDVFGDIEKNILQKNPKGPNQDKLSGNASMNYSRKMAFDLVPKQEYDTLIYCRYDIGFRDLFKFNGANSIIVPLEESYNLISDIFAIMPMSMADSYFLYNDYERLHSTEWEPDFLYWLRNVKKYPEQDIQTHLKTRYCPHLMLMRNIIMNGHIFTIANLPVFIQR
jgi:hypothetical protein